MALDAHGQLVHAGPRRELQAEVRGELLDAEHDLLDLRGEQVHAAQDDHVVVAPGDLLDAAHARSRGAGQQPGEVAGAVPDDREGLLGERGEDELAHLAVGEHAPVGSASMISGRKWSSQMWLPSFVSRHSLPTPGPMTSLRP